MGRPSPNCKPRICKLCGTSFVPVSTHQSCCNREIEVPCAVCGKLFKKKCTTTDNKRTCSDECNLKFQDIRRKENAKKIKKTCKWCGKEFYASHIRVAYCDGPHYKNCIICGQPFQFDPKVHIERQTCSDECTKQLSLNHRDIESEKEKQRQSLFEKYGVYNAAFIPGVSEKAKQTSLERYGKEWYTQTDEYKEKVKKTNLEKYGTEWWLSSQEAKDKRLETVRRKYGSDNIFTSEYGKQKIKEHWEQLGLENPSQLHIENMKEWNKFKEDTYSYLQEHYPEGVTIQKLAHDLGVSCIGIHETLSEDSRNQFILRDFSKMETAVSIMLEDIHPGIIIHHNRRKLIPPYEIDLYLPEYNIGIECNPTWTHNSSDADPWEGSIKDASYHKMKTDTAKNNGIFLIHIFGYEWSHEKDKIESLLRNLLNENKYKIYARNTIIKEISTEECNHFLNINHLEGSCDSIIQLGLYFQNELVFVMTFRYENNVYELTRFCSKLDTSIVGGFSKLLKYFRDRYHPHQIKAYSDRSHFTGGVYYKSGFNLVSTTEPKFKLINLNTDDMSTSDGVEVYDSGQDIWMLTNNKAHEI